MLFPQNKFSVRFFSSCRKRSGRKRSLGQDNIFSSVCQEFCPQGGLPQCMLEYQLPLASRHPPWQGKPPARQTPPSKADTPLSKADPLARRPPPPCAVHARRYGQQAGGMHPTGMQSCFKIISQTSEQNFILHGRSQYLERSLRIPLLLFCAQRVRGISQW